MTGIGARCSLLTCVALLWSGPGLAQNGNPYLSAISIERVPSEHTVKGGLARLTLHVHDPSQVITALSLVDGLEVVASDDHTVSIVFVEKPTVRELPDEKFRSSTFVIDFDEEAVLSLSEDLHATPEKAPSTDELVSYVRDHIGNKTYSRSFDLASRVAKSGEGDCTEHAVLLAALARSSGYYARVTLGTLILDVDTKSYAFGHAWTEIYDGTNWRIKDATIPEADSAFEQMRYLPIALLGNEGPGYFLALAEVMNSMPSKITGYGSSD